MHQLYIPCFCLFCTRFYLIIFLWISLIWVFNDLKIHLIKKISVFTIKIFGYMFVAKKKPISSKFAFGMVIHKVHEKKIPCNSYNLQRIFVKEMLHFGEFFFLCRVQPEAVGFTKHKNLHWFFINFFLPLIPGGYHEEKWKKNVGCFKEWNACHSGHYVVWNAAPTMEEKICSLRCSLIILENQCRSLQKHCHI